WPTMKGVPASLNAAESTSTVVAIHSSRSGQRSCSVIARKMPATSERLNTTYGPNTIDQFRRAGGYASRILNGEKAADLPVEAPTKNESLVNLKTAKPLGIDVPTTP